MLKEKLKQLRLSFGLTQEQEAQQLGVSSQTVSKWERGLLSPDISLLPKIAELYDCTIDSLFGMNNIYTMKHHREIGKRLKDFADNPDWKSEYHFWLEQIQRFPDVYSHYIVLMSRVLDNRAFESEVITQLCLLTDHAEAYCDDADLLDAMHYNMVRILGEWGDKWYADKLNEYHKKLPHMCYGKERLSKYVLSGEDLKKRELSTIMFSVGQMTDSILNLITPEMSPEEKLYYYKKTVDIIETVTEEKYAAQYEIPLLGNCYQIALLLKQKNENKESEKYIHKIFDIIERHMYRYEGMDISKLLFWPQNHETARIAGLFSEAKKALELIEREELFSEYRGKTTELKDRYIRYFNL